MSYFVHDGNMLVMVQDESDIAHLAETFPNCIYFEAFLVVENIEVTIEEKLNDYTKCVVKIDDAIRFIGRSYG